MRKNGKAQSVPPASTKVFSKLNVKTVPMKKKKKKTDLFLQHQQRQLKDSKSVFLFGKTKKHVLRHMQWMLELHSCMLSVIVLVSSDFCYISETDTTKPNHKTIGERSRTACILRGGKERTQRIINSKKGNCVERKHKNQQETIC